MSTINSTVSRHIKQSTHCSRQIRGRPDHLAFLSAVWLPNDDIENALRCSPVDDVADVATESVDDVTDVATDALTTSATSVATGRSVGDASPKRVAGERVLKSYPIDFNTGGRAGTVPTVPTKITECVPQGRRIRELEPTTIRAQDGMDKVKESNIRLFAYEGPSPPLSYRAACLDVFHHFSYLRVQHSLAIKRSGGVYTVPDMFLRSFAGNPGKGFPANERRNMPGTVATRTTLPPRFVAGATRRICMLSEYLKHGVKCSVMPGFFEECAVYNAMEWEFYQKVYNGNFIGILQPLWVNQKSDMKERSNLEEGPGQRKQQGETSRGSIAEREVGQELGRARKKVFLASILFVDDLGTVDVRARHCGVCRNTIVLWDQWFRDVIVESFLEEQQPRRNGGPNKVVHIDETYVVKRKYNR
ncbi:unnamed protein product [Heligmosomoides polygyrus]|uniref:Uncharacterized protein n=1 Tax=Heligmosomoides polygyrus TaxID=6339 RepID=A0A3P8CH75_HELPZ|nr:unnamed protein product [Heligmosomoides polygyrus]